MCTFHTNLNILNDCYIKFSYLAVLFCYNTVTVLWKQLKKWKLVNSESESFVSYFKNVKFHTNKRLLLMRVTKICLNKYWSHFDSEGNCKLPNLVTFLYFQTTLTMPNLHTYKHSVQHLCLKALRHTNPPFHTFSQISQRTFKDARSHFS